jgi:hypothetical protein
MEREQMGVGFVFGSAVFIRNKVLKPGLGISTYGDRV